MTDKRLILDFAARSSILLLLVAGVGLLLSACQAAPRQRPVELGPVATGPGTLAAARKYLEGRWALESFEVFPPGRPAVSLKGQGAVTYDQFGNLEMEIRTDEQSANVLRSAGIEIKGNVISTSGRTVVDMANRTLTYVVQGQPASSTGPLALHRPRHWDVTAEVLTLTTRDENGKPLSVGRWRKMP